ncbi:MAG: carboxymuconolactone decarboxylase family protein [Phycisphaerales bacterium JB039]
MPRIDLVNREQATGKARQLLDAVHKKFGRVPNITAVLANAPAALDGYLSLSGALAGGRLSPALREQIAITVAAANSCDYCLAAHSAIAESLGVSPEARRAAQRAEAGDPTTAAALQLARRIVETRGFVDTEDLRQARAAGLGDGEILEVLGAVVVNIFTNYTNHIAETEIDFPAVERDESLIAAR